MQRRVVVGVPVLQSYVPADSNVQMVLQLCVNRPTTVQMRAALLKQFARLASSVISPRCVLPSTARLVLMCRVQANSHVIPVLLDGSAQTLQHQYCALRDILVLVGFRPQRDAKLDVSATSALLRRSHVHPVSTVCEQQQSTSSAQQGAFALWAPLHRQPARLVRVALRAPRLTSLLVARRFSDIVKTLVNSV